MGIRAKLRELVGERAEERDYDPHLFGVEVATEPMSAHHEHWLAKGGPRTVVEIWRGLTPRSGASGP